MLDPWVAFTIAAAFFQNIRFMLQKVLKGQLSTLGVTFARFLFGLPFTIAFVAILMAQGATWPGMNWTFVGFALAGGLGQIIATAMLVALFSLKNFAVGVTFSKTETVATVLLSIAILGEGVGPMALLAIFVTVIGVVLMSGLPSRDNLASGIFGRPALIGIASGALFAVASIGYRGAALALDDGGFMIRAAVTLAFVVLAQTIAMALWLAWREPGEILRTVRSWRMSVPMGVMSALGSLCWFAAFALMNAAYVKALGQIELIFTFAASVFFFKETPTRAEVAGIITIIAGILLLLAT